jgi:hypothetical protein
MPVASPNVSSRAHRTSHAARVRILFPILFLLSTSSVLADTIRVTAERALVWSRPSGVSVVITQLTRGAVVEVVRRLGDWYEILLPSGTLGSGIRTGFILASQVVLESVGPPSAPAARASSQSRPPPLPMRGASFFNIDGVYRKGRDALTRSATSFSDALAEEGARTTAITPAGRSMQWPAMR